MSPSASDPIDAKQTNHGDESESHSSKLVNFLELNESGLGKCCQWLFFPEELHPDGHQLRFIDTSRSDVEFGVESLLD